MAAARAARHTYGRLLAFLAAKTGDIALTEAALADAFMRALRHWPDDGVPANPDTWMLTAARRRRLDHWRLAPDPPPARLRLIAAAETLAETLTIKGGSGLTPDRRLALLFVCTHPTIPPDLRAPLALQCTLGIDTDRLAEAFRREPSMLAPQLADAKAAIRTARIPFEKPGLRDWPIRMRDLLDVVRAIHGSGWDKPGGSGDTRGLTGEALRLGALLCRQLPDEPEVLGLMALMLFREARAPACRDDRGHPVPLDDQDTSRWRTDLIEQAEVALRDAAGHDQPGPCQLEAAIQSARMHGRLGGTMPAGTVVQLYDRLIAMRDETGATDRPMRCARESGRQTRGRDERREVLTSAERR